MLAKIKELEQKVQTLLQEQKVRKEAWMKEKEQSADKKSAQSSAVEEKKDVKEQKEDEESELLPGSGNAKENMKRLQKQIEALKKEKGEICLLLCNLGEGRMGGGEVRCRCGCGCGCCFLPAFLVLFGYCEFFNWKSMCVGAEDVSFYFCFNLVFCRLVASQTPRAPRLFRDTQRTMYRFTT